VGRNVGDDKLALEVELVEPEHEDGGEEVVQQKGRMPRLPCTQTDTMDSRKFVQICEIRQENNSLFNVRH
jgi:hypothetical protein